MQNTALVKVLAFFGCLIASSPVSASSTVIIDPSAWELYLSSPLRLDPSIVNYLFNFTPTPFTGQYYRLSLSSRIPPAFADSISFDIPGTIGGVYGLNTLIFGTVSIGPLTQSTSLSMTFNVSDPSAIFCYTQLNGALTFPILHEGQNFIVVPGVSTSGNQQIACENYSASDVRVQVSQIALFPDPIPSPSPTPSPTPSPSSTPNPPQFALDLAIKPKAGRPNAQLIQGVDTLAMRPTSFGCGQIPFFSDERTFVLKCINRMTGASVEGCHYRTRLLSGPNNGGHEHRGSPSFRKSHSLSHCALFAAR